MRLPWPFGRSEAAPADTSTGAGAATPAILPGAPGPAPDAPPTGAWASLPPIQRVSGEPPVVGRMPPTAALPTAALPTADPRRAEREQQQRRLRGSGSVVP